MGNASSIMVVENLTPLINAKILIKNPYTDLPLDPDIILGGGNAKYKRDIKDPAIKIPKVLEKRENVLIPITKRRANITRE